MKFLTQEDASAIADKLKAERVRGRRHELVRFHHKNRLIVQFGIRRSSKEVSHGYIPLQMKISQRECRLFRDCTISLEDYINILTSKGVIINEPATPAQ